MKTLSSIDICSITQYLIRAVAAHYYLVFRVPRTIIKQQLPMAYEHVGVDSGCCCRLWIRRTHGSYFLVGNFVGLVCQHQSVVKVCKESIEEICLINLLNRQRKFIMLLYTFRGIGCTHQRRWPWFSSVRPCLSSLSWKINKAVQRFNQFSNGNTVVHKDMPVCFCRKFNPTYFADWRFAG